ncbi:MAG: lactate utilization protein [Desulfarculaceae bacterium]
MTSESLLTLFNENAETVSAKVHRVASLDEAFAYAVELTRSQGGVLMAAPGWDEAELKALGLHCQELGIEILTSGLRQAVNNIHTGLTKTQWGAASTGTLVVDSASEDIRLATMLCETHVAVLEEENIFPSLESLAPELTRLMASGAGYTAFISGPSRTADIELVLTEGVHGPQEVHILILTRGSQ